MQHLTLEDLERLARKQTGCTDGGCVFGHPGGQQAKGFCLLADPATLVRLLVERDSLERERDSLRLDNTLLQGHRQDAEERCRSLTVERDAARAQTGRVCQMLAEEEADSDDLRARLSRAREALGSFDENPPPYRAGHLVEGEWRIHQARALAALRAALAEPLASS